MLNGFISNAVLLLFRFYIALLSHSITVADYRVDTLRKHELFGIVFNFNVNVMTVLRI